MSAPQRDSLRSRPLAAAAREAVGSLLAPGSDRRLPIALYAHFPFCLSICPYCDFVVYAGRSARGPASQIDTFVDAVVAEIGLRGVNGAVAAPLKTVYIGGGTPSLMSAAQVGRLLEAANRAFGIALGAEITIEVNPGPGERGDLAGFRAAGVNRVSIGAQSFVATELKSLGRRHEAADVHATVAAARDAGFDNISLDLLYDVPGQTLDSWRFSLDEALRLGPEHVSAYALDLSWRGGRIRRPPPRQRGRAAVARSCATRTGRRSRGAHVRDGGRGLCSSWPHWYEVSNWSRSGRESRHNLTYWTGAAWEAVGPGAHAFDGVRTRRWNLARLESYLSPLSQLASELPPGGGETVAMDVAKAEAVILALRTSKGIPASTRGSALDWARANGLLELAGDRLRLTMRGRLLSNEVFARLLPEVQSAAA